MDVGLGGIGIGIAIATNDGCDDGGAADVVARCVAWGENRALPLPGVVVVDMEAKDMEAKDDSDVTACGVIV